jgi:hypothetical protein
MKVRKGLKRRLQEDSTMFIKMRYADGMYEIYMAFLDPWMNADRVLFRTDVFKDAESLLKNCRYEYVMSRIRTLKEERINKRVSKL